MAAALRSALMDAAASGDTEQVERLVVQGGVDPSAADSEGWTPLIFAARDGHARCTQRLLELGARANPERVSHSALRGAAMNGHLEVCQLLLAAGADPSQPSNGGRTPLMGAVRGGFVDVARLLVEHGADVSAVNSFGETALSLAQERAAQGDGLLAILTPPTD
mmetsp:Transcript_8009/g.26628  ORF Transcript_8009/g.26628 Transcript_8009/m.26628 type:complete len:164 (-) Transcript_8009:51-542(-)|eukprot:CAMPEP_0170145044 /NCGR_PEP_ID=MMETSP0033_2-20121228/16309_1 /TAXON_ID=195969 /ORGANISM="Dolichomastix tenuilepis, Strain CCMP3274" /LENGTH=163 /DNA_ID=CAMNT_0010381577 /DNA_START=26 /DNA_END=517 /DNA_ORIENTATION=+